MTPDQTAPKEQPKEQPDLGPYYLQYRLSKYIRQTREQTTIVVNGEKRVI